MNYYNNDILVLLVHLGIILLNKADFPFICFYSVLSVCISWEPNAIKCFQAVSDSDNRKGPYFIKLVKPIGKKYDEMYSFDIFFKLTLCIYIILLPFGKIPHFVIPKLILNVILCPSPRVKNHLCDMT